MESDKVAFRNHGSELVSRHRNKKIRIIFQHDVNHVGMWKLVSKPCLDAVRWCCVSSYVGVPLPCSKFQTDQFHIITWYTSSYSVAVINTPSLDSVRWCCLYQRILSQPSVWSLRNEAATRVSDSFCLLSRPLILKNPSHCMRTRDFIVRQV